MNGLSGLLFSCRISDELLVHMESVFTPICHSYVELQTGQWAVGVRLGQVHVSDGQTVGHCHCQVPTRHL